MSPVAKRVKTTEYMLTRVTLKPVSQVTLEELRDVVRSAENLPGHSKVHVYELLQVPTDIPGTHAFRGLTVSHTVAEDVPDEK